MLATATTAAGALAAAAPGAALLNDPVAILEQSKGGFDFDLCKRCARVRPRSLCVFVPPSFSLLCA